MIERQFIVRAVRGWTDAEFRRGGLVGMLKHKTILVSATSQGMAVDKAEKLMRRRSRLPWTFTAVPA